ncbi:MAG: nitrogen fixation protein NifX [Rhodospirillaceae bacterium]|nr:MAG: nitrogen fixation protein NifX [Rhodospirillaceae bacterium]
MKVAIATQDMKSLNAHFGSAHAFAIYDVSRDGHHLVEVVTFEEGSHEDGRHADAHEGDDRIGARIEALGGVALLFVLAIGGPAAARVIAARIHPIKLPQPQPIEAVLERVRTMLSGTPPPWLRRLLAPRTDTAFLDQEDHTP